MNILTEADFVSASVFIMLKKYIFQSRDTVFYQLVKRILIADLFFLQRM